MAGDEAAEYLLASLLTAIPNFGEVNGLDDGTGCQRGICICQNRESDGITRLRERGAQFLTVDCLHDNGRRLGEYCRRKARGRVRHRGIKKMDWVKRPVKRTKLLY